MTKRLTREQLANMEYNENRLGSLDAYHEERMQSDAEYREAYEELALQREIAKAVSEARRKQHLSQQELANRAKTTQAVISRIENGNVDIGVRLLQRIAHVLNFSVQVSVR